MKKRPLGLFFYIMGWWCLSVTNQVPVHLATATCWTTVSGARAEEDNGGKDEQQNNRLFHLNGFDFTNIELNFEGFSIRARVFFLIISILTHQSQLIFSEIHEKILPRTYFFSLYCGDNSTYEHWTPETNCISWPWNNRPEPDTRQGGGNCNAQGFYGW